jgi:hypothetical protein
LSVCLSVCLPVSLSVSLSVCLSVCLSLCLSLCLSVCLIAYLTFQHIDNATKNEVRRFVFSGPLTPGGVALRDVTLTKK